MAVRRACQLYFRISNVVFNFEENNESHLKNLEFFSMFIVNAISTLSHK